MDQSSKILLDMLEINEIPEKITNLTQWLLNRYDLEHIAYHTSSIPGYSWHDPFLHLTYTEDWLKRYRKEDYLIIDPVVQYGFSAILPFDWDDIPNISRKSYRMLAESKEFGIGPRGLSFPVRGPQGYSAIFTLTSAMSIADWRHLKRRMSEINLLAHYFHSLVLETNIPELPFSRQLTPRERECLQWAVEGKTVDETALILAIAPVTVRAHLDSARSKMNAVNKIHTVIKAMRYGIVN